MRFKSDSFLNRPLLPVLVGNFFLSSALAALFFVFEFFLTIFLTIWWAGSSHGWFVINFRAIGLILLGMAINGYALAKAIKIHHFLGYFNKWPGLPEEDAIVNETRLVATSAREAFFHGDYGKVPRLIDRLTPASVRATLAKGRALTMGGNFDESLPYLELGGQGRMARRYLRQRRFLGLFTWRYFSAIDLSLATQKKRMLLPGLMVLGLCGAILFVNFDALRTISEKNKAEFSEKDFKVTSRGTFTLHYHDEAFMQQVADISEEALPQTLDFLGLPPQTFAAGQIHLYLCSDQAEFLSRSPNPHTWEAGYANYTKDQIVIYQQHINLDIILAHELTHLCYYRVVPNGSENSWLNEGFANYMGYKFALGRLHYPRQAWLQDNYFGQLKKHALPFAEFLSENPQNMKDDDEIHTFYRQGFSIVYVLIEDYGQADFLTFLHTLGSGKPLPEALASTYPTIRNSVELEAVWDLFMR